VSGYQMQMQMPTSLTKWKDTNGSANGHGHGNGNGTSEVNGSGTYVGIKEVGGDENGRFQVEVPAGVAIRSVGQDTASGLNF
jgi:hypothetical protein